jgi:hypothetical protein
VVETKENNVFVWLSVRLSANLVTNRRNPQPRHDRTSATQCDQGRKQLNRRCCQLTQDICTKKGTRTEDQELYLGVLFRAADQLMFGCRVLFCAAQCYGIEACWRHVRSRRISPWIFLLNATNCEWMPTRVLLLHVAQSLLASLLSWSKLRPDVTPFNAAVPATCTCMPQQNATAAFPLSAGIHISDCYQWPHLAAGTSGEVRGKITWETQASMGG